MKRIVVLLMAIVSVMFLCSCKDDIVQRAKKANIVADTFDEKPVMQFVESKELKLGNTASNYCYYKGFIYCLMPDDEINNVDKSYKIIKYNLETEETSEVGKVSSPENDNYMLDSVSSLYVTGDEIVIHCLVMTESEQDYSYNYVIHKIIYDMDGNKKSEVQFEEDENIAIINKCVIDNEGNSYILTMSETAIDSFIIKYDAEGKKLCVSKMQGFMDEIEQCNDRIILYRYGMNNDDLGYYDVENDKYEPSQFADIYPNEGMSGIVGAYNSEALIMSEEHLYSYDCNSNELKALIDIKDNNIDYNSIIHVEQISDEEVILIYSSDGFSHEIMYCKSDDNNN